MELSVWINPLSGGYPERVYTLEGYPKPIEFAHPVLESNTGWDGKISACGGGGVKRWVDYTVGKAPPQRGGFCVCLYTKAGGLLTLCCNRKKIPLGLLKDHFETHNKIVRSRIKIMLRQLIQSSAHFLFYFFNWNSDDINRSYKDYFWFHNQPAIPLTQLVTPLVRVDTSFPVKLVKSTHTLAKYSYYAYG